MTIIRKTYYIINGRKLVVYTKHHTHEPEEEFKSRDEKSYHFSPLSVIRSSSGPYTLSKTWGDVKQERKHSHKKSNLPFFFHRQTQDYDLGIGATDLETMKRLEGLANE